jgi:hypothetical protein
LFSGSADYYKNDIGTWNNTADWENLTAVVLAGDAALPQSGGGTTHTHTIPSGTTNPGG